MALTRVTAGLKSTITQLNQIIDHLEGVAGSTLSWFLRTRTGENFIVVLGDDAGVSEFQLMDSNEAIVFTIDSEGNVTPGGAFSPGEIIVPGEATPTATDLGNLRHDEDGFFLTIGTGSATKRLGLVVGAGATPTITGELTLDTTTGALKAYDGTSARQLNPLFKYVTATQTISASTALVDVIAAGSPATMSFSIGANEVWRVEYHILLTFTSTGGAKFQITGPAAPTAVNISGWQTGTDVADSSVNDGDINRFTVVTAFATNISAGNAASTATASQGVWQNDAGTMLWHAYVYIANGANAGTVTLQIAQNTAAGTAVVGIGSNMLAQRMA